MYAESECGIERFARHQSGKPNSCRGNIIVQDNDFALCLASIYINHQGSLFRRKERCFLKVEHSAADLRDPDFCSCDQKK